MNNIQRVQQNMRDGLYKSNPIMAMDDLVCLTGDYSFYTGQLEDILSRKSATWNKIRLETKSDASAEKIWDATEDGINETGLNLRLKRCKEMMSTLRKLIGVAQDVAHNNF